MMSHLFSEVRENIIGTLNGLLGTTSHLMKGGQALALHLALADAEKEARFSKDIDFSVSGVFPFSLKDFCTRFKQYYNENFFGPLAVIAVKAVKAPKDPTEYFGVKVQMHFGEVDSNGRMGKKVYFHDITSLAVTIDFACNERVPELLVVRFGDVRTARVELIVAEKIRALCSYPYSPNSQQNPRPKDFYDLFVIYSVLMGKNPTVEQLKEIKLQVVESFRVKSMPLDLIDRLEDPAVIEFHSRNYDAQVIETLSPTSRFKRVTFAQVYNDSLELIGKIMES